MKQIILYVVIFYSLLSCKILFANTKDIGDDYYFGLTYSDAGTHQTGKTINLSIKRASDLYWFDFNDNAFKNSGWTTKATTLTEDSTNKNYYYRWTSQGGDSTVNSYVFHVECTSEFISEDVVHFQNIGTGTGTSTFNSASDEVIVATNNDKTNYTITTTDKNTLVDLIWDEDNTAHTTSGTTGNNLHSVGVASDPWGVELPATYTGLQAGYLLSHIKDSTDGDKESGEYTGIEKTIRSNR